MGSGVTLTAVLRLLHRAAIPTFTICPQEDFSCYSRWCCFLPGAEHIRPGDFHRWLDTSSLESAVLLPCGDDWLAATAALPPETARRFPSSIAPAGVIQTFVDKWRFAQLLDKEELPRPRTQLLNSREDIDALPDSAFQGAILKPMSSLAFSCRYGVKGFLIRSRGEARRKMQQVSFPIMLQEFIPGPPNFGYFVEGFVDQAGRMCALFARRRLRMYPMPLGNSTFMESVPLDEVAGATMPLQYLLESVSYRGIFSAEFKYDERDGFFKMLEINTRPYWYIEAPACAGIDLCRMAYLDALGSEIQPVRSYKPGQRLGYPVADLRGWQEQRRAGGPSFWSWLRSWRGAQSTPFAWNDPLPAIAFAWEHLRQGRNLRQRHPLRVPTS